MAKYLMLHILRAAV